MPYLGKQSEQVGVSVQKYEYLQGTDTSSGTTSFSVPSDSGDHVNVWLNGILLKEGGSNDYSKSNTTITFNSAPSDNDLVRIDVVESFALPDALKSSGDTMEGALKLDGGIKQQTSADLSGTYADHQFMLSDSFSVTGDVTISDNLVLAKLSDDGNAITLTNDTSTRTITGSGSLEASTLAQTPNASLTGMTGTIGSNVVFPAGHILQVVSTGQTGNVATTALGDVVNAGIELTIGSGNKAFIIVTGWIYTSISGAGADRKIAIYKEVSGSDTVIADNQPGAWGETESQFARSAISGSFLDNTTGTVKYKIKVSSLGTAGTMSFRSNLTVFEIKG